MSSNSYGNMISFSGVSLLSTTILQARCLSGKARPRSHCNIAYHAMVWSKTPPVKTPGNTEPQCNPDTSLRASAPAKMPGCTGRTYGVKKLSLLQANTLELVATEAPSLLTTDFKLRAITTSKCEG